MTNKVLKEARSWAKENNIHGPHAFFKFVIFRFVEQINKKSKRFVFKGGNLIWVYIKSPRPTVDLDLSTIDDGTKKSVKTEIANLCKQTVQDDIRFELIDFIEFMQDGIITASVKIGYKVLGGAENIFKIDIVYEIPVDTMIIRSPVSSKNQIIAASIENIIADKLQASWQFRGGNTRLKDYDDLWRIAKSDCVINQETLTRLLKERGISGYLNIEWLNEQILTIWKRYTSRFKDLPNDLSILFSEVNDWLKAIIK